MEETFRMQFTSLVHDTLCYIHDKWPHYARAEPKAPPLSTNFGLSSSDSESFAPQIVGFAGEANGQRPFANMKSIGDASKVPEGEGEKPKTQVIGTPLKDESKKQATDMWTLTPMPLPVEYPQRYTSFFSSHVLTIAIRLFVAGSDQQLFLESVARAATQFIAPAAVFSGKLDALFTNQNVRLVLAPLSLLKKRFPQVELHRFYQLDGPTLLPIADHYDPELKRALWNSLKSFRNTLLSS